MKNSTAASKILISLAAVAGCNDGDADYVSYKQTSPSEFEQSANQQAVPARDSAAVPGSSAGLTAPDASGAVPQESGDVQLNASTISKSAVQVINPTFDESGVSGSPTPDVENLVVDNATPVSAAAEPATVVSSQSGLRGTADIPEIDNTAGQTPNKIELLIPVKSFRRERGTDAVRVGYDDIDLLKILNMEPVPPNAVEYFPDWLASLNGKQIRIRGWMYPTFVSEGLTSFTMARDNGICCFTRMPKIYDVIFVKLEPGQTTNYIDARPFDVEGTFRIDNEGDGSELPRLYKIENARVLD